MSILIKGMEMPEHCGVCRFAVDGWCYAYGKPNIDALANNGRTNFCPLVHVPEHGRLIDADELLEHVWRDKLDSRELIAKMIDNAQIIIPAEEGE